MKISKKVSSEANTDFVCPICGKTEREYEQGHLIIYSAERSVYDLQMISVDLCSRCADGAFEAIQRDVQLGLYKLDYYC